MDPFSLIILTAGVLGAAAASSVGESQAETERRYGLLGIFNAIPWHYAMSYDWDAFTVTVWSSASERDATGLVDEFLERDGINLESDSVRVYAIIRGGVKVLWGNEVSLAGQIIHVIWQVERSIEVIAVQGKAGMSLLDVIEVAWEMVPVTSDVKQYEKDFNELPQADMIVVGGEVIYKGEI